MCFLGSSRLFTHLIDQGKTVELDLKLFGHFSLLSRSIKKKGQNMQDLNQSSAGISPHHLIGEPEECISLFGM